MKEKVEYFDEPDTHELNKKNYEGFIRILKNAGFYEEDNGFEINDLDQEAIKKQKEELMGTNLRVFYEPWHWDEKSAGKKDPKNNK